MAKRKYHTLIVLPNCEGARWSPQFGDYDREVVRQEQGDTKEDWPRGSKFKIVTTPDASQKAINAKIAELNGETTND